MKTMVKHMPHADEVWCRLQDGRTGVRKKLAVFGPWVAVKLDGHNEWRNVERQYVSSKAV